MTALQAVVEGSSLPVARSGLPVAQSTLPVAQSTLPAVPAWAMGGLFFVFVLFFVIFSIVLPLWVYSDAQSKGSDKAVLWALVVFLAPVLGLVLYLLLGDDY